MAEKGRAPAARIWGRADRHQGWGGICRGERERGVGWGVGGGWDGMGCVGGWVVGWGWGGEVQGYAPLSLSPSLSLSLSLSRSLGLPPAGTWPSGRARKTPGAPSCRRPRPRPSGGASRPPTGRPGRRSRPRAGRPWTVSGRGGGGGGRGRSVRECGGAGSGRGAGGGGCESGVGQERAPLLALPPPSPLSSPLISSSLSHHHRSRPSLLTLYARATELLTQNTANRGPQNAPAVASVHRTQARPPSWR